METAPLKPGILQFTGRRHCLTCTLRPAHAHRLESPTHALVNSTSSEFATPRLNGFARQRTAERIPDYHGLHGNSPSPCAGSASRDFPEKPTHIVASPNLVNDPLLQHNDICKDTGHHSHAYRTRRRHAKHRPPAPLSPARTTSFISLHASIPGPRG